MRTARERARALGLRGIDAQWERFAGEPWLDNLLAAEETERARLGIERRTKRARVGRFKPMADFDWSWPKKLDRKAIEALFSLAFLDDGANVVFVGPNGVGKTMIAKNLTHAAISAGRTVRFTTASGMLHELVSQDGGGALQRALRRYSSPNLLVIDEVGYLSYDHRHADLLFEVVNRRYDAGRSILLTTNKPFGEWNEVFPNATCVVTLVDRLVHHSEIISIHAPSYRLREAEEKQRKRAQ
jgi:DNA replication protein DnaC